MSFGRGTVMFCRYHFDYSFILLRQYHDLSIVSGYYIFLHFPGIAYLWGFASVCLEAPTV